MLSGSYMIVILSELSPVVLCLSAYVKGAPVLQQTPTLDYDQLLSQVTTCSRTHMLRLNTPCRILSMSICKLPVICSPSYRYSLPFSLSLSHTHSHSHLTSTSLPSFLIVHVSVIGFLSFRHSTSPELLRWFVVL